MVDDHAQPEEARHHPVLIDHPGILDDAAGVRHELIVQVPLQRRSRIGPSRGAVELHRFAYVVGPPLAPVDVGTILGDICAKLSTL